MNNFEHLPKFAINLNEEARQNKIEPIIGRDDEIRNVIRILSRKTKNNPILIGQPGVGKTAIAQGIALKIVQKDIPKHLQDKEVWSLDIGSILAGAKFQGEFEERMKNIINEVKDNQDKIVLFIDEIHTIIGAGKTSGPLDGAQLLKPMLARGELSLIGATTLEEYKQHIEKDLAFERRFQKVIVHEPTQEESINILRGLKENLEVYHGVSIDDEAIITSVKASTRYINDRFLPDKAIDLLDEACANINVQLASVPEELEDLNQRITALEIEKNAYKKSKNKKAEYEEVQSKLKELKEQSKVLTNKWNEQKNLIIKEKDLKKKLYDSNKQLAQAKQNLEYEKASELEYQIIPELQKQLSEFSTKLEENQLVSDEVTPTEIYQIISRLTNIPLENLQTKEKDRLLNLESNLNTEVIGQESATKVISESIIRNRVDIGDPNRPIGSFLFLGPTGVGKTEIAKSLCFELFNDKNKMFRLDMSEFMEKHSISKIIGAPPGYIGYDTGSSLCEYVRTNPYSVILFDEIEKAHPDVLNVLLQILDEGHLTDNKGRKINFKNTVLILTSNIASHEILENPQMTFDEIEIILKDYLRPEFINRLDEIIKFNPIDENMYLKISNKLMDEFVNRLQDKKINLEYSDKVSNYIYDKSYTIEFGARPIKRFIQKNIENNVAVFLLKHDDIEDKTIYIDVIKDEIAIKFKEN